MDGFLNFNKPSGWTSHDCVAFVRRQAHLKRVGHGGTLDPAATGVLPMALGRATRLLQYLRSDKAYQATIRFGVRTSTDDLDGEVIDSQNAADLSFETVRALLPKFQGTIQQVPPQYSAIQVGGKRLYDLARSGVEVEVPVRTVDIYRLDVLQWRSPTPATARCPELEVAIACSSGTYIRAIARDLGELAGVGATLAGLCRIESSGFALADSLTADQVEQAAQNQSLRLVEPAIALQHLPKIQLDSEIARRWRMGQRISLEPHIYDSLFSPSELEHELEKLSPQESAQIVSVFDESDRFLGVSQVEFISSYSDYGSAEPKDSEMNSDMNSDMNLSEDAAEPAANAYLLRPRMVFCPT